MDNVKQQTILALDLGTITGFAIKDQSGVIISFHDSIMYSIASLTVILSSNLLSLFLLR